MQFTTLYFTSELYNISKLNDFFSISNEEGFSYKARTFFVQLWLHQLMEVGFFRFRAHLMTFMLIRSGKVNILFIFMVDLKFKEINTLLI